MTFAMINALMVGVLFAAMLALQELGRRLGERDMSRQPGHAKPSPGPAEGAVYGLLGLFLAFTFHGAGARYEARRHLAVDEANAIGTAWLRIDILPEAAQPQMRERFRQYTDARLDYYRLMNDDDAVDGVQKTLLTVRDDIWKNGVAAATASGSIAPFTVFLPAVNTMFDISTTREEAARLHPPPAVFLVVATLALIGAVYAGFGMAGRVRSRLHTLGFAAVVSMALFVILDFEFPRLGLIRVDVADSVLRDVRDSMR